MECNDALASTSQKFQIAEEPTWPQFSNRTIAGFGNVGRQRSSAHNKTADAFCVGRFVRYSPSAVPEFWLQAVRLFGRWAQSPAQQAAATRTAAP